MAKPEKSTPLMISIAEKVGATMGRIVATTTDAVEEAARTFKPKAKKIAARRKSSSASKAASGAKPKRVTIKKIASGKAKPAARKRKLPAKKV